MRSKKPRITGIELVKPASCDMCMDPVVIGSDIEIIVKKPEGDVARYVCSESCKSAFLVWSTEGRVYQCV